MGQFIVRCLKMKEETYQDFLAQLRDLEKQIAKRAVREMTVSAKNLVTTRWLSMTDRSSFIAGPLQQILFRNSKHMIQYCFFLIESNYGKLGSIHTIVVLTKRSQYEKSNIGRS